MYLRVGLIDIGTYTDSACRGPHIIIYRRMHIIKLTHQPRIYTYIYDIINIYPRPMLTLIYGRLRIGHPTKL